MDFGFGLWTLFFGIQVKVSAKGLWALDLGLCVMGFLFRALDFELLESRRWILDFEFGTLEVGLWILGFGFRLLDLSFLFFLIVHLGFWTLGSGLWT